MARETGGMGCTVERGGKSILGTVGKFSLELDVKSDASGQNAQANGGLGKPGTRGGTWRQAEYIVTEHAFSEGKPGRKMQW